LLKIISWCLKITHFTNVKKRCFLLDFGGKKGKKTPKIDFLQIVLERKLIVILHYFCYKIKFK